MLVDKIRPSQRELEARPEKLILPRESFHVIDPSESGTITPEHPDYPLLEDVLGILNHPDIYYRLQNVPKTVDRMIEIVETPKIHLITVLHPETKKVIGTGSLEDGYEDEHQHWVHHVGVDPEYQGRDVGKQLYEYILFHGFTTRAHDSRWREIIYVGITLNKWYEAMKNLVRQEGSEQQWTLQDQVGPQQPFENWADLFVNWENRGPRYDTERHKITFPAWVRRAAEGKFETLNRIGITDEIRQRLAQSGYSLYDRLNSFNTR